MAYARINKKLLRQRMAEKDIFTFSALAKRINRSETTVYLMIERPSRFSSAIDDTLNVLGLSGLHELQDKK